MTHGGTAVITTAHVRSLGPHQRQEEQQREERKAQQQQQQRKREQQLSCVMEAVLGGQFAFRSAFAEWEGSEFLMTLLEELYHKLLQKLALLVSPRSNQL